MNIKRTTTAPTNGTNCVQYVTIGGTPTSGTFQLTGSAGTTGQITWSATNLTLLANVQAALDTVYGSGNTLVEDISLSSGIGVFKITFQNGQGKQIVDLLTYVNSLSGTSPTIAIAIQTAGVEATHRNSAKGQVLCYVTPDPPAMYQNTSNTPCNPSWDALPDTSSVS
ncbi:MAG: hypothetical protein JSS75_07205 [Bacteroidetes bacterium]|nr:hypothetical protein [Bacteroidota bacterium]